MRYDDRFQASGSEYPVASSNIGKRHYVLSAVLLGLFVGSTPSQAQQAGPPSSVTLQEVDVSSGTGTGAGTGTGSGNNVENLPMLLQTPQIGLTGTKVEDLPMSV